MFPIILVLIESWIRSRWKDFMGPLVQSSAQNNVSAEYRQACSGLSQVYDTFRDGDSTTLVLNLFQCLITLIVNLFYYVLLDLP